jgi:outer membrane protein assembly factor BamB
MYQMDPLHTGRSPHAGPQRLGLLRSFDTTAPANRPPDQATVTTVDIQSSTAVGPDGVIYATTFSGWSYALKDSPSASDRLDLVWRFRPTEGGSPAHGTPAVSRDGSLAYIGYGTGTAPNQKAVLFALRTPSSGQDAQIAWQADLGPGGAANSPTLTADGTLYYVTVAGLISAIDTNGGKVKWTAQIGTTGDAPFGQTVKVAPAVAPDGTVYVTAVTGSMYAVSPPSGSGQQGSIKWSFDFGQHLGSMPLVSTPVTNGGNRGQDAIGSAASATIGPDGTIYVGANNSNFYAIDPNGQQKWMYEAERELAGIWTTAALSPDASVLFFGANKGGLYALNTRDGSLKWQFPIFGSVYSSPALDTRGILYTGTSVGHVFAVDSASGEMVADYDNTQAVWTAPSIRPDSTLVMGDRMGKIFVLG